MTRDASFDSGVSRALLFSLLIVFLLLLAAGYASAQVPGSAERGKALFTEKGCVQCHSFEGAGGKVAPDLAQKSDRQYTPVLLASQMWNHGPTMWNAVASSGGQVSTLTTRDAADLFAYFYSRLYFATPGDAGRGKALFERKSCAGCHDMTLPGTGPPIANWRAAKDPIAWSERMWNHSGSMYRVLSRTGLSWPSLSGQEMADLLVYLRNVPAARSLDAVFQSGDAGSGERIFSRTCANCHTLRAREGNKVDLLRKPDRARTLVEYASDLWNHAPAMNASAAAAALPFPVLREGEMPDLIAFLFSRQYFYEQGDAERGGRIYRQKNCALCHETERTTTKAPDLSGYPETFSVISMTSSLWRHGPAMLEEMSKRKLGWPVLQGRDLGDLIAYLNSQRK